MRDKKIRMFIIILAILVIAAFAIYTSQKDHTGKTGNSTEVEQVTTDNPTASDESADSQEEATAGILENNGDLEIIVPDAQETTGE